MRILICGYGFVGKAHALALSNKDNEIHIHDPNIPLYTSRLTNPDAVIICVSTPESKDGSCDMTNVYDVLEKSPDVPILIKSTISLEGWRNINKIYSNKKITFSPEYLRANRAWEDFKNQKEIYIGGGDNIFWASLLSISLGVKVKCADPEQLILAKYTRNSFLALKVAFFNQIYDLCVSANVDFNSVRKLVIEDERIGSSHSHVHPERGFGGHCFPKDTAAFVETAEEYFGSDMSILREAIEYNKRIRGE